MNSSQHVSRRTIAKGAAWAAPAITLGAPAAFAAASSPCTPKTAVWIAANSTTSATGSNGVSAVSVANGGTYLRSDNFSPATVNNGSALAGQGWLTLDQSENNAQGQTVTITLPTTAYCVTFYVNDIDTQFTGASSRYRDQVGVANFTASTKSPYVTVTNGTATTTNTATSPSSTYEWDNATSANGLAMFSAAGPIKTITLTYTNQSVGTGTGPQDNMQQILISPITYSTTPCACS